MFELFLLSFLDFNLVFGLFFFFFDGFSFMTNVHMKAIEMRSNTMFYRVSETFSYFSLSMERISFSFYFFSLFLLISDFLFDLFLLSTFLAMSLSLGCRSFLLCLIFFSLSTESFLSFGSTDFLELLVVKIFSLLTLNSSSFLSSKSSCSSFTGLLSMEFFFKFSMLYR